jgi:hypothetical protein
MMTEAPDQMLQKRVELILQQLEGVGVLPSFEELESDPTTAQRAQKLLDTIGGEQSEASRKYALIAVGAYHVLESAKPQADGLCDRREFWNHCVAVGCCAELIAEHMIAVWGKDSQLNAAEAFVCGFLHDIGKVVLETVLPKSFSRAVEAAELLRGNIADVERNVIGIDHMVAGKRLAERWELGAPLRDCIWLHGLCASALPSTVTRPRLVNLITLADILVREQHIGFSGNYTSTVPRQALIDAVGVTPEQVDAAISALIEQIEPHATAIGIGQTSAVELYQGALSQANRQLDRV